MWIVDAHGDDGKLVFYCAFCDELLTAFLELERAVCLIASALLSATMLPHNHNEGGKRFFYCVRG